MKCSVFSSSGFFCFVIIPPTAILESKTNIFCAGVTWKFSFFLFLDAPQIDYIHAAVLEKRAAFFSVLSNLLLKQNKDIKTMA